MPPAAPPNLGRIARGSDLGSALHPGQTGRVDLGRVAARALDPRRGVQGPKR
ncbi:uncharacterized protein SOCE836_063410 [Sorangium cellulosum]|uniref:Uncharacterized protein n=1 Tax=Sorangium cellulosum TaxID=56 RepID=A0A4V0NGS3_SORCE|nr:uncharacterized protein SOCE836_063410 [Sorangium cellulosum]WCQ93485.1 hypothetical protein NQZ70_06234 [Sorangium sp. Soce836]